MMIMMIMMILIMIMIIIKIHQIRSDQDLSSRDSARARRRSDRCTATS